MTGQGTTNDITNITVNGTRHALAAPPETPLALVLRNLLDLPGTRYGCGLEQCGACRVLVDGELRYACTTLLGDVAARRIDTVEHLGPDHPLIDAFLALNAGQCGFCLSGILVTASRLLRDNPAPTRADVQVALKANLCRCGAHNRIIDAILRAAHADA